MLITARAVVSLDTVDGVLACYKHYLKERGDPKRREKFRLMSEAFAAMKQAGMKDVYIAQQIRDQTYKELPYDQQKCFKASMIAYQATSAWGRALAVYKSRRW